MKHTYLLLFFFCVGCGKGPSASSAAATPAAQAPPSAVLAAAPVASSAAAPAPPPAAAALATADNDRETGRAEVMELKRISGDMLMLRIAIVNTGTETLSLATGYSAPRTGDVYSVSGVTLVDPVNKKKYFVVRDSANNCLCSENLKDLKPGGRIVAWTRFPAPPDDVQKISVLIPLFSPMDDVAIAR
jgi:hypothetical protein